MKKSVITLVGLAAVSLAVSATLGGCTVAETGVDAPPSDGLELPSVRLPSIRLSNRPVVTIDSLMADSAEESVAVSGTVAQRVAVLEGWLYEVQDETGSLWVITDRSEPVVGEQATVEGVVRYESIRVDDIDASDVYLEEESYRQGGS